MSKDNCLHQMTDEPTRNDNILDQVMTINQDLVNDLHLMVVDNKILYIKAVVSMSVFVPS
jgi:hypothetical protein